MSQTSAASVPSIRSPLTDPTLAEAFLTHCHLSKTLSAHTIKAYRQDLDEYLGFLASRPEEGEEPEGEGHTDRETSATIEAYIAHLRGTRELSPATVRRRIACLKAYFKWRERSGTQSVSPFHRLDISLKIPRRLPRALSREEMREVWSAPELASPGLTVTDTRDARVTTALAVRLMATTGVRVGELTVIRLGDVSLDGGSIRILGKGNRERTVFVGDGRVRGDLSRYLIARRREGASNADILLVGRQGGPLTPQAIRLRLKRLSETLDMTPHVTPHRFRHTAATHLIEEGVDIRFVQRLLGHGSIATTEIYTRVSDTALKEVVGRVRWG